MVQNSAPTAEPLFLLKLNIHRSISKLQRHTSRHHTMRLRILHHITTNIELSRLQKQHRITTHIQRRNFTIGNIVTWIGCFLAFISMFMTFATVSILGFSQTVTLFDTNDGKLFLAVILAVAVINFFRIDIISLIGSCVGVFFLLMEYKDAADKLQQFSSMVHYGIGRVLLTVGIILMVLGAVASIFLRKKNVKLNVLQ